MSIKLENVTKTYFTGEVETHAVKNVDLEIMNGEFIVLLGPSGSGKSTMLNIISGLDNPTSGKISIDDEIAWWDNEKTLEWATIEYSEDQMEELDKERIKSAIIAILKELEEIRNNGITEDELMKAKNYIEGGFAVHLETANRLASWYTNQLLFYPEITSPDEYLKKLAKLTVDDINKVAKKIFITEKINLALIGDLNHDKKELEDLLKIN